ncbi:MAG TPA: hypothetical protein PLN94_05075, partial [Thiolinea sp.]|nr:hypothetical protein [Thiolinea sp.]
MNKILTGMGLLVLSASASANFDFFDNNDGEWKMGPYGPYYDSNDWPEWTPMYWMQEMMDSFDDNNNYNYGGMPFMNGGGYGMPPFGGYNGIPMPYGYGQMPM